MKKIIAISTMLILVFLVGCSSEKEKSSFTGNVMAMDTYMAFEAYGENGQKAIDESIEEIKRLEKTLSAGDADSNIGAINQRGIGTLGEDEAFLLEKSLNLYHSTAGSFDITIYPVVKEWGFISKDYHVPTTNAIKEKLDLVGSDNIIYNKETKKISFKKEGMAMDFGGIAKGYASKRVLEIFKKNGITSGIAALGGNVQTIGVKPDGSLWRVAIQNPDKKGDYLGVVSVNNMSVITSGGYERYFEEGGVRYHHIIDPKTGMSANSGLTSVTIVSDDAVLGDGLSTALFIMGKDKAIEYWKEHKKNFDFVFLDEKGTLWVSKGLKDSFSTENTVKYVE